MSAVQPPQDRDQHGAGHGGVGIEFRVAHAFHQAVVIGKGDRAVVPTVDGNVVKGHRQGFIDAHIGEVEVLDQLLGGGAGVVDQGEALRGPLTKALRADGSQRRRQHQIFRASVQKNIIFEAGNGVGVDIHREEGIYGAGTAQNRRLAVFHNKLQIGIETGNSAVRCPV